MKDQAENNAIQPPDLREPTEQGDLRTLIELLARIVGRQATVVQSEQTDQLKAA
jgi:hypothetical protein